MIQVILALMTLVTADTRSTCSVQLEVESKIKSVRVDFQHALFSEQFIVRIINTGSVTITLVEPGDGSDRGWRTPILSWQVQLVGSDYKSLGFGGCGNINALRPDEVFELKPGESRVLVGFPSVSASQVGTYKLRLRYENDPNLEWSGIPLGEHDPNTMLRVRDSTTCVAISNEVEVEVTAVQ